MATFNFCSEGPLPVLEISGRIEPDHWKDLQEALTEAAAKSAARHPKGVLLVDLANLEYIASSGFRELFLTGRQLAREDRLLVVCSLKGEVKRVFQLASFATVYPIFENRAEALAHFATGK